ncbi:ELMO/CED-12 family-domain-containing protein [Xylaria bambusicola]|uniref:ELMO/CED-12 family-domain-containing protein n=1 Tax=Xylaria bambusicola TaxID=326684 RepID=UPI002007B045|nr:ELMO/CED-12 family-domain-containing protein [Xylaria bambusicola]KAI0523750.1 ELMO/CED-12 family-domain-containing protein [Xylaria bambusicola]
MDQAEIPALLARLASDEDASRKMAVFKLQSSINDPSFADVFISSGGLIILRRLIMNSGGNTLAYSLQSLSRLLEVDMGWEIFDSPTSGDLVDRIVELVVSNPLVNILRGAMSILVALVGHSSPEPTATPGTFGFRALRPAIAVYPQFFDLVVQKLQSADHALCATTLSLINALIRDAVTNEETNKGNTTSSGTGEEWPKFIKRLQDLGLIKSVYTLMQSAALQDLAHPLLEFQCLTKVLLKKWRKVRVDLERPEHRRALKGIHLASAPSKEHLNGTSDGKPDETPEVGKKGSRKHHPEKWRRLGFESESPSSEFQSAGFLGMMDLTDYVRKNEDGFQKLLLEQSTRPLHERCPVARASMAVTLTLFEHFDCSTADIEDTRVLFQVVEAEQQDKMFQPLLLQWSRLHTAGLQAFFRLWKATGAEQNDFEKVVELVRILIDRVVGQAGRHKDVVEIEEELSEYDLAALRKLQMDLLSLSFEDQWGDLFSGARRSLKQEALDFVKEQRARCLLQGSWFSKPAPRKESRGEDLQKSRATHGTLWRYAKLSHNRRYLHWADFGLRTGQEPGLDALTEKVDLRTISSVVSNVSERKGEASSTDLPGAKHSTKITIYGFTSPEEAHKGAEGKEEPVLVLYPLSDSLASEWLDGLLMLLEQSPITAETNKLVDLVVDYGMKIRLLKVRMEATYSPPPPEAGVTPSRDGLDADYFYDI